MSRVKTNIKRIASIVAALSLFACSLSALAGCSFFDALFGGGSYIEFTRSALTLQLGDEYDLSAIIGSETSAYELVSSDRKIVGISGHTAKAYAVGVAFITAETSFYSDRIRVTVTDKQLDGLTVEYSGELIQTIGKASPVTFTPVATGALANADITWTVDGESEKLPSDKNFIFMPSRAGAFDVTATSGSFSVTHTVRCYYETDAAVKTDGEFTQQAAPYTDISLYVTVERNELNPPDYIEVYGDDELLYCGTDTEYSYRPTPGRRTLSVKVNGKSVFAADVYFRGSVTPEKPNIEFDDLYPHVYLNFDAVGEKQVEITSGETGAKTVYSSTDTRYKNLFTDNGFDVGGLINLCASSGMRKNHTFRVKSLGDGDVFTESEYSESLVFTQLPSAAKRYVETVCLDNDLYITSESEYVAVAEYYIDYRPKNTRSPKVAFECYIAYDMSGDEEDLWNDAFPIAATSGEYRSIRVSMSGNVLKTSFTVNTVNAPSMQAPERLGGGYSDELHAILPHINYDADKYRPDDYAFPIDSAEREQEVYYTDELYLAVQRGVKPVPSLGSPAYTVYELARNVLKKICTDDMTDVQKAHAVYDWIMWHVTYDTPATYGTSGGEMYSAYYLEGVFADGVTPIGGVVYEPYAVCDGISKAYSLLCNMEGIPCVRVVGTAGDSVADAGGHAWNKVFVNGAWYAVDCTWGDATATMSLNGLTQKSYELGLHDYLFVTESRISEEHYEPYQAGTSAITYAPVATDKEFDIYKNMPMGDGTVNCYVAKGENADARVREISTAFAESYKNLDKIAVPLERNGVSNVDWQGFEIYYEGAAPADGSTRTLITNTIRATLRGAQVRVFTYDNILLVLVKA